MRLRDVYTRLIAKRAAGASIAMVLVYESPDDGSVSTELTVLLADDGATLRVRGADGERVVPISTKAPTGRVTLDLSYVDLEVRAAVAGAGSTVLPLGEGLVPRLGDVVRPAFFATGDATPLSLQLDKDHHYTVAGHNGVPSASNDDDPMSFAYAIPEGRVFVLGDNSYSSNDSRFRPVGTIPVEWLIGPVVFRIWPPLRVGTVR